MSTKHQLFFFFLTLLLLSSCSSNRSSNLIHYTPSEPNMLKLMEKNDLKVAGSFNHPFSKDDKDEYYNLQIGYSPIKHLGIFVGQTYFKSGTVNFNNEPRSVFSNTNFSIGGYYPFLHKESTASPNQKVKHWLKPSIQMPTAVLLELYGGVEFGEINNIKTRHNQFQNRVNRETSNFSMHKKFIKAGIHFQRKFVGVSINVKYGKLNYYKGLLDTSGFADFGLQGHYRIIVDTPNNEFSFLEPSLNFHFGINQARIYSGITVTGLSDAGINNSLRLRSKEVIIYLGMVIDINDSYKTIKKQIKSKKE